MIEAAIEPKFESWRERARALLQAEIAPEEVFWNDGSVELLPSLSGRLEDPQPGRTPHRFVVPKDFLSLAETVAYHRAGDKWALLYRVLFRLTHGKPQLLELIVDDDVHRLYEMEKSVRRDIHKMHAFVRFRRVEGEDGEEFIAFHRPDHFIVPAAGPWFKRRFPIMRWTIFTPDASVRWDGEELHYGGGVPAATVADDGVEELWRTYYGSIFNPARIKIGAMKKEMPVRHWRTLPETRMIDDLLREAPARVEKMMSLFDSNPLKETGPRPAAARCATAASAAQFVPKTLELPVLRESIATCKGCELYCHATQPVFGEGPADAIAMFVGEQPGDQEDLAGKPFVGPAGQLLDEILQQVGIDRSACYVTNAVKHFKFETRGKRRIHSKPNAREMSACRPWLEAEIAAIKPRMIIALGATAAQTLMGPQFRITASRGKIFTQTQWSPWVMATIHPSALLRIPDPVLQRQTREQFVEDLRVVSRTIQEHRMRENQTTTRSES
jgi:DNA polymerase